MSTVIPAVNMPSGEPGNDKSATHTIRWPERSVIPPEVSCLYSVIRRRSAVAVLGLRAAMLVVQFEQLELDNVTTSDRSLCKPLNVISLGRHTSITETLRARDNPEYTDIYKKTPRELLTILRIIPVRI